MKLPQIQTAGEGEKGCMQKKLKVDKRPRQSVVVTCNDVDI
jgi:hypothetical protein